MKENNRETNEATIIKEAELEKFMEELDACKSKKTKPKKAARKRKGVPVRVQLLVGFLIPVIFVVIVGLYSYGKAEIGMLNNYEESSGQAVSMAAEMLDYGFQTISSDSLQLFNSDVLKKYCMDYYSKDPIEKSSAYSTIYSDIITKQMTNDYASNLFIVVQKEISNIGTSGKYASAPPMYDQMIEKYGERIRDINKVNAWFSYHDEIDAEYGINSDTYIISIMRDLSTRNGLVIVDVDPKTVLETICNLDLGQGSLVGFVTPGGRELLNSTDSDFTFFDKDYYQACAAGEETDHREYVTVDGEEYLFMYSRCVTNNTAVCALVPKEIMMTEAIAIRHIVNIVIVAACLVVLALAFVIIRGIATNMNKLKNGLTAASQGDLTIEIDIAENTEFGNLARYITEMVTNTKLLIRQIGDVSDSISESVDKATSVSETLAMTSEGIQTATDEIRGGIKQQVEDAEGSLAKMDSLSDRILDTHESIAQINGALEDSRAMIEKGTEIIGILHEKAGDTGVATDRLGEKIVALAQYSREIEYFVNVLNEIAEETSLLSLNASIEAARAGDAGRGFAVVAEEIRKLADNSLKASAEIGNVVKTILTMTEETKEFSTQARESVEEQGQIVDNTMQIFNKIDESVEALIANVGAINTNIGSMNDARTGTLQAIESISGVTQQTATAVDSVGEAINEQHNEVETISEVTSELDRLMKELKVEISKFTV